MYKLLFLTAFLASFNLKAQPETVGLKYIDDSVSEGYTVFSPMLNNMTYLLNNCGEVLHQWTCSTTPKATSYFLENGLLLRAGTGIIEKLDWDSNILWSINIADFGLSQHHDFEPLPNGNVLIIMSDSYTDSEIIAQGKNTTFTGGTFKLDKIVEIKPIGTDSAEIVWEWKFFDHLIQDFDVSKPNFGIVANSPELVDLNYDSYNGFYAFTHVNAIDYNADLDQIIISPRHLQEIIIIDHSTTTAEAASHSGGNSGKGGDLLWRWGNPETYDQGDSSDRKLGLQHDVKWITEGDYVGGISVFNNQDPNLSENSTLCIIIPEIISGEYQKIGNVFGPQDFEWSWNEDVLGTTFGELKQSGLQILPNNHALAVETSKGRITEIDEEGNVVWVYVNPHGNLLHDQFDNPDNISVFRADKYNSDYPGFIGKNFTNLGTIEDLNSITEDCILQQSSSILTKSEFLVKVAPNPTNDLLFISGFPSSFEGEIFDLRGNSVLKFSSETLDISHLSTGQYFLILSNDNFVHREKFMKY